MTVCIAQNGQRILSGMIFYRSGNMNLRVVRNGVGYICELDDGPAVNRRKPAADVMFESVVNQVRRNALGVLMTGMGV